MMCPSGHHGQQEFHQQTQFIMLTTVATIIGVILLTILMAAVAGSLCSLVYFLASARVTEAQERLTKVREYEASVEAKQNI